MYVNPKLLIYLPFPFDNHKFVFYVCEAVCVLYVSSFVSFLKKIYLLILFIGCAGSLAAPGLSLAAVSMGYSWLRCTGFSVWWLLLL